MAIRTLLCSVRGMDEEEHAEARDQDLERHDEGPVAHPVEDPAADERAANMTRARSPRPSALVSGVTSA